MVTTDTEPSPATFVNGEPQNVTRLVGGILDDATKLISQHIAMFRAEVRQDFKRSMNAAKYLGVGTYFAAIGLLFLLVSLVPLLNTLVPTFPLWACWAIVGGALIVVGIAVFAIGQIVLGSISPMPNQTLAAIQEDVTWITKPRT